MAPNARTQNAIVAVLAALAVGASGYAVWSVERPHPSLDGARAVTDAAQPSDDAVATTSTPEVETADPSTMTETEPAVPQPPEPSVEGWVSAWSEESDLLVIGDGYSNMPNQWVQLWAQLQGSSRPVQIHHWGEAADVGFNDPIVLSDTGDVPLTVWSASRAGSTIQAAADRYEDFVDASSRPDAVLITLGRSSTNEDIAAGLDALVGQIEDEVDVLVAIGPEGLYEAEVGDSLLTWARDNDERVSVVDLREVAPPAPTAEQWADAFDQALGHA